jgi:hypothetical protein
MPLVNSNTNTIPSHRDKKGSGSAPPPPAGPQTYEVSFQNLTGAIMTIDGIVFRSPGLFPNPSTTTINPPNNLEVVFPISASEVINISFAGNTFTIAIGATVSVATVETTAPLYEGLPLPMNEAGDGGTSWVCDTYVDNAPISVQANPDIKVNYTTLP